MRAPPVTQRGPFPSSIAPFDGGDFRVRVGLRRLDPAEWLEVDGARAAQLALKEALYEERYPDVVVALDDPEVEAAALELHEMIDSALRSRWGVSAVPVGDGVHPIAAVGLSTQEDWCLLTHAGARASSGAPQAAPVLGCASVCFPTRWTLTEKLGLTVGEIHGPVLETAAAPELLARLRVSLAALPPDVIAYKGLVAHAAAIDQWCGEQLAAVADADQL